jgi:hypothetical protein
MRGRSFLNWFFARDELARARESAARLTPEQRESLRRARVAYELGDFALAPGDAVQSGSAVPLARNLFRQALYWALLAQRPGAVPVAPEALWASTDAALLDTLTGDKDELARLASSMSLTFVDLAEGSEEKQRASALELRAAATRLLTSTQRDLWQLEWLQLKRVVRLLLLVLICMVPVAVAIALWPAKADLAKGKPWRTSSIGYECHPERSECGGATTEILFHTKLDPSPWFQYDFGSPLAFSSVTIRNRSDFGSDRAVPLVVEVSNDAQKFSEVARRTKEFTVWKPSFPTQHARYLRVRVARESMLHLEAVEVHR